MTRWLKPQLAVPILVLLGTLSFFFWGLQTPKLERVWRMRRELRLGDKTALKAAELRLFQATLERYPKLGPAMVEDEPQGIISRHRSGRMNARRGYLIRTREEQARLRVQRVTGSPDAEVEVEVRTTSDKYEGKGTVAKPFVWVVPPSTPRSTLIELRLIRRSAKGKKRTPTVRIDWIESDAETKGAP